MAPPTTDVESAVERLLASWKGEIQAGLVYGLLAQREGNSRRAEIISAMAEAEQGHRNRIEKRLRELGREVPDASSVGISPWLRLQARLAPLPRVLARMERAEEAEITDRYKRPTGDTETDALLASIRKDEQSHSRQLKTIQAGTERSAPDAGLAGPQARLDRILGRERWHQSGSGWISGSIYGANDGLAAVFGIVSGVSGATGGSSLVLTAGLAGAIASGLSMATGAFLAERSEAEVAAANVARERQEIQEHPEEEREELSLFYQLKGLDKQEADILAERLGQDPEALLKVLATEELGGATEGSGHPVQAATAAGLSTFLGAMVPVLPFFFIKGLPAVVVAAAVSLVAHFLVGAAKSLFTLRSWWAAGLEMTVAGVLVGGATFVAGLLYQGH
jgi:vacuolar iron transporter family protein